jgi:hypothetical protein
VTSPVTRQPAYGVFVESVSAHSTPHRNLAAGRSILRAGAAFPGLRVASAGAILLIFEAPLLRRKSCLYSAWVPYCQLPYWSDMLIKRCRDSAAEFRCQSPAALVLVPGIPLPDGSGKWHTRPCYRGIIRRSRGDFRRSNAISSLTAGRDRGSMKLPAARCRGGRSLRASGSGRPRHRPGRGRR